MLFWSALVAFAVAAFSTNINIGLAAHTSTNVQSYNGSLSLRDAARFHVNTKSVPYNDNILQANSINDRYTSIRANVSNPNSHLDPVPAFVSTSNNLAESPSSPLSHSLQSAILFLLKYINNPDNSDRSNGWLKRTRHLDARDCLLRIVCEISSNHDDASDPPLIKHIRHVFRRKSSPKFDSKRDSVFAFMYAGHVGSSSNRAESCYEVFPLCTLTSETLLTELNRQGRFLATKPLPNHTTPTISRLHSGPEVRKIPLESASSPASNVNIRHKMNRLHQQFLTHSKPN